MPVYNKRGILLLPKVIVLNPKDGMPYISGTAMVNYATMPMTVEVGGATIFVINVDHYEKI